MTSGTSDVDGAASGGGSDVAYVRMADVMYKFADAYAKQLAMSNG